MFVNLFKFVMQIFFPEDDTVKIANNKQSKDNPSRRVILADRESEVLL